MGIIAWIVFGFVVGLLARALAPGKQSMGIVMTTLLGVAGSLVGGLVATTLTGGGLSQFRGAGFLGSLIGAILLLVVGMATLGRRQRTA